MAAKSVASGTSIAGKTKITSFLTKNSMTIALVAVFILFSVLTGGRLLYAQNLSNLMLQNGYRFFRLRSLFIFFTEH